MQSEIPTLLKTIVKLSASQSCEKNAAVRMIQSFYYL